MAHGSGSCWFLSLFIRLFYDEVCIACCALCCGCYLNNSATTATMFLRRCIIYRYNNCGNRPRSHLQLLFFFSFYYTTPCVWLFDSTNIPCLFFHSSVTITETKWKCMCSFLSVCGETLFLFDPSCFLLSISSHSCYLLSTDFLFLCFILSTFPAAFLLLSIHNTP